MISLNLKGRTGKCDNRIVFQIYQLIGTIQSFLASKFLPASAMFILSETIHKLNTKSFS